MLVLPKSSAPTMQSRRLSRLKQEQYRKSHHCPAGRFYTERRGLLEYQAMPSLRDV